MYKKCIIAFCFPYHVLICYFRWGLLLHYWLSQSHHQEMWLLAPLSKILSSWWFLGMLSPEYLFFFPPRWCSRQGWYSQSGWWAGQCEHSWCDRDGTYWSLELLEKVTGWHCYSCAKTEIRWFLSKEWRINLRILFRNVTNVQYILSKYILKFC